MDDTRDDDSDDDVMFVHLNESEISRKGLEINFYAATLFVWF